MARVMLGMNAAFAVGRYPEPEAWLEIVGKELDLRYAQFFSDLLDPKVEEPTRRRQCERLKAAAEKYRVTIHSLFSGTVPHWSHTLLHPDEGMRKDARRWWEEYIRMAPRMGVKAVGSFLGSFSLRDLADPKRKQSLTDELTATWEYLSGIAREEGLEYMMFEPMSVPREIPATMAETEELYERLNEVSRVPARLCLDIGHGAARSGTAEDNDPYAWIRRFGSRTEVIHLQQTDRVTSKHWPFTEEYNRKGIITAEKVLAAIGDSGAKEMLLVIEVFHSFFEPMENQVIDDLKVSVDYWRGFVKE